MKKRSALPFPGWKAIAYKTLLVMKLTTVLLIAACLQVSAEGTAQKISLSQKNTTLEKVFKELHKKTGYEFFYRDEVLQKAKKFDIKVVNATIEEVLERCFQDQPLNYSIANNVISIKEKEPERQPVPLPPPVDVKGTVYDEKGKPLAGVSIIVVGEKKASAQTIREIF